MKRAAIHSIGVAVCLTLAACAGGGGGGGEMSSLADPAVDRQDFEFTTRAASGGDINAQIALADMYRQGIGTPQDVSKAASLYRKPAEQGNPLAQYAMGESSWGGQGVPQNLHEAALWFAKSAAQGNPLAQYRLGVLHLKGQGVPLDPAKAFTWLSIAEPRLRAASTNPSWYGYWPNVKDALDKLPSLRDGAAKRLRTPEMDRARQEIAAWKPTS